MNDERSSGEFVRRDPAPRAPLSLLRRLVALLALLALLASAIVSGWWILTNQADFSASRARSAASEAADARRQGNGD